MNAVWGTAALCLTVAAVVGLLPFSLSESNENDIRDSIRDSNNGDNYELCPTCMTLLRMQVNMEMHASLVYMNMAAHFGQNGIARNGFSKLFRRNSREERDHAQKLIDYLNLRGSKFGSFNIDMPEKISWVNGLEALNEAIILEKKVYNQLNHIHYVAETHCKDSQLMDYLEQEYFNEQIQSINQFIQYSSILGSMVSEGMAEYMFDRQLDREIND